MKKVYVIIIAGLIMLQGVLAQTSSGNTTSSGNVVSSGNTTTTTTTTASTISIDTIMSNYKVASSGEFSIANYQKIYYLAWKTTTPVTIIRGDFDTTYLLFKETTVYSGKGTLFYIDTVGNTNTKYYILSYLGGRIKVDINKQDFYNLVMNNETKIDYDADTLQREVHVAVFGKAAIVKWYSVYEDFAMDMDYSGSVSTDYNIGNSDGDKTTNYFILDNLNNLSSITAYDVDANFNKKSIFSLAFKINMNQNTSQQTLVLVGGTSQNIMINNGTMNTINDGINSNTNTVDNRQGIFVQGESSSLNNSPKNSNATKDAMNSLNGEGGGGGGGCFLR